MGEFIAEQIADSVGMHRYYNPNDNGKIAGLYGMRSELNAALLTYRRKGNERFRISDEQLGELERFAYSPRLLSEKS